MCKFVVLLVVLQLACSLGSRAPLKKRNKSTATTIHNIAYLSKDPRNVDDEDVHFGERMESDLLLDTRIITARETIANVSQGQSAIAWYFYGNQSPEMDVTITSIQLLNHMTDNEDAYAPADVLVTHGGMSAHEVSMLFISHLGYGFKYQVQLYGILH